MSSGLSSNQAATTSIRSSRQGRRYLPQLHLVGRCCTTVEQMVASGRRDSRQSSRKLVNRRWTKPDAAVSWDPGSAFPQSTREGRRGAARLDNCPWASLAPPLDCFDTRKTRPDFSRYGTLAAVRTREARSGTARATHSKRGQCAHAAPLAYTVPCTPDTPLAHMGLKAPPTQKVLPPRRATHPAGHQSFDPSGVLAQPSNGDSSTSTYGQT